MHHQPQECDISWQWLQASSSWFCCNIQTADDYADIVDRLFIYRLTEKLRDKQSFLWQVHDVHLDVSFNSSITSELYIYLEQELQSACYEKR
jgi:hypothetical protein